MRNFILRARRGPTSARNIEANLGGRGHFEVIAHCVVSALYVSRDIRADVCFHMVLEGPPDPPKIVSFDSSNLFYLEGFDERTIAEIVSRALTASRGLANGECREIDSGLSVSRMSFERLVRDLVKRNPVYLLSRKGEDIRRVDLQEDSCFIFTDHLPMQKKTYHLFDRLGVRQVSLGPTMLFAAHCIVLVHNELDRRKLDTDLPQEFPDE